MNAKTPHHSVKAITPWMCAFSESLKTVPCWCSVRHQVTEKCTIGTSTNAISAAIAHRFARVSGAAGMRRSARYPM